MNAVAPTAVAADDTPNLVFVEDATLMCAVDYALGRQTYIVSTVVGDVRRNLQGLSRSALTVIFDRIGKAQVEKQLGAQVDADMWLTLRSEILEYLHA